MKKTIIIAALSIMIVSVTIMAVLYSGGDLFKGSLEINVAPNVKIESPTPGYHGPTGLYFKCVHKTDQYKEIKEEDIIWISDKEGQIGTGSSFSVNNLTPGPHIIKLMGSSRFGVQTYDQVSITVTELPSIKITEKLDAKKLYNRQNTFKLTGTAKDFNGKTLLGTDLEWSSSIDGRLGNGTPIEVKLSPGTHTVTLKATDEFGGTSADTTNIIVK